MGNVGSRLDDSGNLFFKDQTRLTISSATISNSRGRVFLHLTPNSFPATRYAAKREVGDDSPIEYIQVRCRSDNDLSRTLYSPLVLIN
jgi:Arf-GAP/SH3 domain/ANK repeat/PH domain-containing protein